MPSATMTPWPQASLCMRPGHHLVCLCPAKPLEHPFPPLISVSRVVGPTGGRPPPDTPWIRPSLRQKPQGIAGCPVSAAPHPGPCRGPALGRPAGLECPVSRQAVGLWLSPLPGPEAAPPWKGQHGAPRGRLSPRAALAISEVPA